MKKINNKGFTPVMIVGIILILGIIGFTGYYVYNSNKKTTISSETNKQTIDTITLNDTTKTFSIKYPDSWSVKTYKWEDCCEGAPKVEPDWTKTPQPITLVNQNNKNAGIVINGYKNVNTTIDKEIESIDKDKFNTNTKLTINGYQALKHTLDFVGPNDAEKYKDTTYAILHGNNKTTLTFRERYSNSTTNGENDFDATHFSKDFEVVVNSIKFLY